MASEPERGEPKLGQEIEVSLPVDDLEKPMKFQLVDGKNRIVIRVVPRPFGLSG